MNIHEYDAETIYCRKLGHHLKFDYCRREFNELPCSRIIKCWAERIPIHNFLSSHFSDKDLEKIFAPPVPKMTSLIELIQKAQALNE
ncbi:MAG: hypothetical protein JW956_00375 [Calditrichaceae bacterium]|nr:hypothetical protein [Calditrichaceae bacterium]